MCIPLGKILGTPLASFDKKRAMQERYNRQCCGSGINGIRYVYPGSLFLPIPDPGSRIPDPKTATKERGEKKLVVKPFYEATNFTKF
jgi:hypothetical protein